MVLVLSLAGTIRVITMINMIIIMIMEMMLR
jgi:hypothetical protein